MSEERIIKSRAPLRISFSGGGTDVPPYPEMKGGVVLSATITRYAFVSLRVREAGDITVNSIDYDLLLSIRSFSDLVYNGKLDLVKAAIKAFQLRENNYAFDMLISCDAPPGSGLGSSSATMVAIIVALAKLTGRSLGKYEIADLAYKLERIELGIKGGLQDQYAATFGGFNFMEFYKSRVIVNPLRIDDDTLNELHSNLLLFDIGRTRFSSGILDRQIRSMVERKEEVLESLDHIKEITLEMKEALLKGRLKEFGELLRKEWEYKKNLDPAISNPTIEKLFEVAKKEGARGWKLCGAGGGGHILIYCDLEKRYDVIKALEKNGCKLIPFDFDFKGLQTWEVYKR